MHLVMDFDQAIYACGFATEGEPLSHATFLIDKKIEAALKETKAATYRLYLHGEGNFREDIATTVKYKGTRFDRKPSSYDDLRQYVDEKYDVSFINGMEVDDAVSILLWKDYESTAGDPEKANIILSSPDKDLNNTPGWHHNPRVGVVKWIDNTQAFRHFCFQMLTGDRVDSIPGLPDLPITYRIKHNLPRTKGIGEVTAKKLLQSSKGMYASSNSLATVFDAYMEWGLYCEAMSESQIKEYALEQGRLLWMTRELDEEGKPKLFEIDERIWNDVAERRSRDTGSDPRSFSGYGEEESGEGLSIRVHGGS